MGKASTAYVWFDTEFTSLNLDEAHMLQVAVMITDCNLKRITPPVEDLKFYIRLPDGLPVSDWVEKNLPELVTQCRSPAALPADEVDRQLTAYVDRWCGTPLKTIQKRPILAGNSVHTDWMLARKYFPTFINRLHYRLLDVSSLKIQWFDVFDGKEFDKENVSIVKKYFPEADLKRMQRHDAYYDIIASAAELAYYRKKMNLTV
ncbi:MAG: exonuclease domain-containing protein [Kiritimatiellales bacterium]